MVDCFDERLHKAQCCALKLAADYVEAYSHGQATDQMFNNLMLVDGMLNTLERHSERQQQKDLCAEKKTVYLPDQEAQASECLCCSEIEHIFDMISTLCGGCSCNCS